MWDPSFIEMDDACYILSEFQASSISIGVSNFSLPRRPTTLNTQHTQNYILEFADIILKMVMR